MGMGSRLEVSVGEDLGRVDLGSQGILRETWRCRILRLPVTLCDMRIGSKAR